MSRPLHSLDGYPEILEDLWGKIAEVLTAGGMDGPAARGASFDITEYIRAEWGGRRHYQPKGRAKTAKEPENAELFPAEQPAAATIGDACLAQLHDHTTGILAQNGVAAAAELARTVADLVKTAWVGEYVYVPQGLSFDLRRRDYEIWRRWDGTSRTRVALSLEYGLSEMRLYQIVDKVREMEQRRTQPKLPGVE